MDALKNAVGMGGGENKPEGQAGQQGSEQGSSGGGLMDKFNSMAGGGKESEKKEDYLDKGSLLLQSEPCMLLSLTIIPGIDLVQEKVFGQGPQDNESAIEQAKDEQMSDFIRGKVLQRFRLHFMYILMLHSTRARRERSSPLLIKNESLPLDGKALASNTVAAQFSTIDHEAMARCQNEVKETSMATTT